MLSWLFGAAGRLPGLRREPVAKDLVFGVGCGVNAGDGRKIQFSVFSELADSPTRSALHLPSDGSGDLSLKAWTIFEHDLNFVPGVINRIDPAPSWVCRSRIFEFQHVLDDPADLALQFAPL